MTILLLSQKKKKKNQIKYYNMKNTGGNSEI